MKLQSTQRQLIIREEVTAEELGIGENAVVYNGLGHIVLDGEEVDDEMLKSIKENYSDKYFFRLSFLEDFSQNKNEVRSYINEKNLTYFKPKILKGNLYCFLGADIVIVDLKRLSKSKTFKEVEQYQCCITRVSVDNNGKIEHETLWNKSKYGNIEKFVPKEFSKYALIVKNNRLRLLNQIKVTDV